MANVLIIDDDHQMRSLLREAFLLAGIEAETAADGREAQSLLSTQSFRVVVTDIVMPDMDGFEIIFMLRQKYPQTAIVAISGGGRINATDYLDSARGFGVAATFQKPLNRKALIAKVQELLDAET
ncbi:MAG TPA: response regulator [Fibrobacteraceae bacterium]|nr:response regulator [Fibrobacteraceae bacterium]